MELTSILNNLVLASLIALFGIHKGLCQWSDWWSYAGFSGPSNWRINEDWALCSEGKLQSPINISAESLLFDPGLKHIVVTGNKVSGNLTNLGNDVTFFVNDAHSVTFSLGPLPYVYKLSQIKFHFGRKDGMGTEHTIDGKQFDAEVHLIAYNSDLFPNYSLAERAPRGLAIICLFIKTSRETTHTELSKITNIVNKIQFRGNTTELEELSIQTVMPDKLQYMTYEGSTTQPGCHETVTWILLNRPAFVGEHQLHALRTLRRDSPRNPQAFMFGNVRPTQPLHRRTVRTNINTPLLQNQPTLSLAQGILGYKGFKFVPLNGHATLQGYCCSGKQCGPWVFLNTARQRKISNIKCPIKMEIHYKGEVPLSSFRQMPNIVSTIPPPVTLRFH